MCGNESEGKCSTLVSSLALIPVFSFHSLSDAWSTLSCLPPPLSPHSPSWGTPCPSSPHGAPSALFLSQLFAHTILSVFPASVTFLKPPHAFFIEQPCLLLHREHGAHLEPTFSCPSPPQASRTLSCGLRGLCPGPSPASTSSRSHPLLPLLPVQKHPSHV